MNDGAFIRRDGVRSVVECGAKVVDGRLTILHVEGCRLEEDIGLGRGQPVADILWVWTAVLRRLSWIGGRQCCRVNAVGLGDPSQPPGGKSCDAPGNGMALQQFLAAVL